MNKIKIMNEDLANKIAAGEVVERPANVVKELVENSLDAKSDIIEITLQGAGTKLIKIVDNGEGMDEEDAAKAFLRHATSKIDKVEDLFFISSLGFRGEALPSIASIAKVILKTSQGNIGTKIEIHGGKLITKEASDARIGTIIEVRDLFYNTPARLKYLKSENTELANTTNFIEKLALAYPKVSFSLTNDDKTIIKTSGSGNLLKVIHEIYGLDISKNMLELSGSNHDFEISGYISKPVIQKSNRNYLITIVNGRVVRNNILNKIINDAYHTYKPDGKYPVVVLIIDTDPSLIDVNIHPTKQDIKFSKWETLEDLIFSEIREVLKKSILIPKVEVKEEKSNNEIKIKEVRDYYIPETNQKLNDSKILEEVFQETFEFKEDNTKDIKELELYPCGLVFGTYIVAQNDEGMYLIDAHAAHERINYEKVLKALADNKITVTELLIPINIELSPSDYLLLKEHLNVLTELGFDIQEFGINTITIKAHPTWLIEGKEEESSRKIIELVISLPKKFDKLKFNDKIAATLACKVSVLGNTSITEDAMEDLIKSLVLCDNPYNCPHGRPTIITFTKYELEKMFKRVV